MANTFTGIYIQIVFAVKNREALLVAAFRQRVYQYMIGIANNKGHKPIAIGGIDNHVHLLIKYNITQPLSEFVRDLKALSSKFINEQRFVKCRFEWQRGFGAFSHSRRDLPQIIDYISRQTEHHINMSMEDELKRILEKYDIAYDEKYLLHNV